MYRVGVKCLFCVLASLSCYNVDGFLGRLLLIIFTFHYFLAVWHNYVLASKYFTVILILKSVYFFKLSTWSLSSPQVFILFSSQYIVYTIGPLEPLIHETVHQACDIDFYPPHLSQPIWRVRSRRKSLSQTLTLV